VPGYEGVSWFGRSRLVGVLDVLVDQLDVGADLAEGHDLFRAERVTRHHAPVDAPLADPMAQVRLEEVELAELLGRDFDPDLLVLLP
jgi:hypothetical protein